VFVFLFFNIPLFCSQNCEEPVENVVWKGEPPKGTYQVFVKNYNSNHDAATAFSACIAVNGKNTMVERTVKKGEKLIIHTFTV